MYGISPYDDCKDILITMINTNYPESELTGKIIGCAMEVHKFLGNGFQEVVYQRSLAIEMRRQGLEFTI